MQCITCGTTLQPGMSVCPTCGTPSSYSEGAVPRYTAGSDPTMQATGNAPFQAALSAPPDRTLPAASYTPPPGPGSYTPPAAASDSAYLHAGPSTPPAYPYGPPPPAPQPSRPPQPQGRSRGIVILLAVLVALMIIGGGLLYYFSGPYPAMLHANATATAQAQVNANATGTAIAIHNQDATATAQALATLTAQQNIYTQATSGNLVLNESLAQNTSSRWDSYDSAANGGCVFTGGTYHAIEHQIGYFNPCFANAPTFSNFTFQVQMTVLQGDQGGIVLRGSNSNFKGYLLIIGVDETYGLYAYYGNSGKNALTLFSGVSTAIKGLNQPNLVTIIAQGGQLTLFINKQYADAISDNTYKSGQIALVAQSQKNATEVAYSSAQIWKL